MKARMHLLGAVALTFAVTAPLAQQPDANDSSPPGLITLNPSRTYGRLETVQLHASAHISRSPEYFLEIPAPEASATAVLADGIREVFPHRSARDGGNLLHISLDSASATPIPITSFVVTVGKDFSAWESRIVRATELTDAQLLAAQPFAPLTLCFHSLPNAATPQTAAIAIHPELVRRYEGAKIVLSLDDHPVADADLQQPPAGQHFLLEMNLPALGNPGDDRTARAELRHPDGRSLVIGQQAYQVLPEDRPFDQFEVPFQAIHSFELYQPVPGELTVVAVHNRLHEPYGGPLGHEIKAHTLSLKSGTFHSRELWSVPNHGHFASGGFGDLALQEVPNDQGDSNYTLFASAVDSEGTFHIAWATAEGTSAMRAAAVQPLYTPTPSRGIDGLTSILYTGYVRIEDFYQGTTALAVSPFNNGYILFHGDCCDSDASMAWFVAVSSRLREWVNLGPMGYSGIGSPKSWNFYKVTDHLDVHPVPVEGTSLKGQWGSDQIRISTTDSPTTAMLTVGSLSPEGRTIFVDFPRDGKAFQIEEIDDEPFLFWIVEVNGKGILRWRRIEWSIEKQPYWPFGTEPVALDYDLSEWDFSGSYIDWITEKGGPIPKLIE